MELFNAVLAGSGVPPETEGEADPPGDSRRQRRNLRKPRKPVAAPKKPSRTLTRNR